MEALACILGGMQLITRLTCARDYWIGPHTLVQREPFAWG